jgi:hypothetical protein
MICIGSRIGEERLSDAKSVMAQNMKFEEYLGILVDSVPALMKKSSGRR